MVAQVEATAAETLRGYAPPAQVIRVSPDQLPFIVKGIVLALVPMLILISAAVTLARGQTVPSILELPPEYMPGNGLPRLPEDIDCSSDGFVYMACRLKLAEQDIGISYQPGTHMILSTVIRAHRHQIGDLVLSWGTPTGVTVLDDSLVVYWGKRSAIVRTTLLRPDSPVEWIRTDFEVSTPDPWQGFKRYHRRSLQ